MPLIRQSDSLPLPAQARPTTNQIQARLILISAAFLLFYAASLTLAPAARLRDLQAVYDLRHWFAYFLWLGLAFLAQRETARRLPNRDPYLLPVALLLSGWGLLSIWRLYPDFGLRQSLWLAAGLGAFLLGLRLPPDLSFLRKYKYLWLSGGLLLTALTLLLGTNPTGAGFPRLWLGCCGFYFQPSEPLKLLLIVYLAAYLAGGKGGELRFSSRLLPLLAPTLFMAGLALLLLLAQRDLGTASIFLFLYTVIVYVATVRKRLLLSGALAVLAAGVAGYALFDVVRLRIDAWLNPWADPSGRSYQIVQSLLAVASGGLVGRGPGLGSPGLVPVPHSDFIFAAIAEETGLLGVVGLLLLLALLANRGLRAALAAPDDYRRYLAAGLTAHLVAQSVLIMGGNLRLLPLTGVTLPFVSYGGSSLLTSFLSLLLLVLISSRAEDETAPLTSPQPYLHVGAFLYAGLAAVALATGWWAVYRAPVLVSRTDNLRRVIADRYVYRGAILDRNNHPLAETTGQPGSFVRQSNYPPLGPVLGYTNPTYGQAGLEQSLDPYLRGLQGTPGLLIWWNHLLYGQPPPGLDVRLSLDLELQRAADQMLGDRRGAVVLLDAQRGEILAMASHPAFDANQLEKEWADLIDHPDSPLLNRATLGRYPAAGLAELLFSSGDGASGLDAAPQIRLPTGDRTETAGDNILVSPLQVALAAAALSSGGVRPAPVLVAAVLTHQSGWVILPPLEQPVQVWSVGEAQNAAARLAIAELNIWEHIARVSNQPGGSATWYVGGTLPGWNGTPLSVAVVLEADAPAEAQSAGRAVLKSAMWPQE